MKRTAFLVAACTLVPGVSALATTSYTLHTVASFTSTSANPYAGLTIDAAGNLYGTTAFGGVANSGTVFEIPAGSHTLTTIANLNGFNGTNPIGPLFCDAQGNLYGSTANGGANGYGTVFEVAAGTHTLTDIVTFNGTNGSEPLGGLISDANGNLYGTTRTGGSGGDGTVFKLAAGTHALTTLASFNISNGYLPEGTLVADAAGNLYGTTSMGGAGSGTIFKVAAGTNTLTTLAMFYSFNGAWPYAGLTADLAGNLYGTTYAGGNANGDGTIFELAAGANAVTTLVTFNGLNGANPGGGSLIADRDGNLYGTTENGGPNGLGTVFEIDAGTHNLNTLAAFDSTTGTNPHGGLVFDANGNLYGTTYGGGAASYGAVFELSPVPEPNTAAGLLTLLAGGVLRHRRPATSPRRA